MACIYPLHFLDNSTLLRMPVSWLLHFDDVLDSQQLHDALWTLLEMGDWKKLGGRLRTNKAKKLEIHTPAQYTSDWPAFAYVHEVHDTCLDEHPLAPYLGQNDTSATSQHLSPKLKSFMTVPGMPDKGNGWIDRNVPLLALRITSFEDATLVGITWPHCVMDASGVQGMFRAWSLGLAGKADQVSPILGCDEDVLIEALGHNGEHVVKHEELDLEQWRLKGSKKIEFMLRFLYRFVFDKRPVGKRIYLPTAAMDRLRQTAQNTLQQDLEKGAYIGDNSLLTAWFAHIVAQSHRKPKPITLLATINARFRLEQVKKNGVYLQNMILPSCTFLPRDICAGNLNGIALTQQSQMAERTTESQTVALLDSFHKISQSNRNPFLSLLFGEKDAILMGFNNLAKIGILQAVDFSPALVDIAEKHGMKEKSGPSGRPVRYTIHIEPEQQSCFVGVSVLSKNHAGDYALIACLKPKQWTMLEEQLKLLN